MAPSVIFTGKGSAGSWQVRGEQLGAALGATVKPFASRSQLQAHDLVVVVKRCPAEVLHALRASGRPWVYDIVDAYPQPAASHWTRWQAIQWVQNHLRELQPDAVIWPNRKMREDCDTGLPGTVLYHHHRPSIRNNPIRDTIRRVGYDGSVKYLAEWLPTLQAECARRGWEFIEGATDLADLDVVVAFRGGEWNGYVQENWKSNVKLANAHGSGTPFIGQQESGYMETATGCEYWADKPTGLPVCFDWLESQSAREQIHDRFVQAAYSLEKAAADLKEFLHGL